MAVKLIVGVRDIQASAMIGTPLIFNHIAVATRFFADLLADPNAVCHKHPQDYELVHYATYDEAADAMDGIEPTVLYSGKEWLSHRQEAQS